MAMVQFGRAEYYRAGGEEKMLLQRRAGAVGVPSIETNLKLTCISSPSPPASIEEEDDSRSLSLIQMACLEYGVVGHG